MAYSLSFAQCFFLGDGSMAPEELPISTRPTSVYQALRSLSAEQWQELAREVFGVSPEHLDIETVLARIMATNTCANLDSPVEVFIDAEGWYRVLVYDLSIATPSS